MFFGSECDPAFFFGGEDDAVEEFFVDHTIVDVRVQTVALALQVTEEILAQREPDTLTVFAGRSVPAQELEVLTERVASLSPYTDLDLIQTESTAFELLLSFE